MAQGLYHGTPPSRLGWKTPVEFAPQRGLALRNPPPPRQPPLLKLPIPVSGNRKVMRRHIEEEEIRETLKVMRDLAAEGRTMLIVTHEMAFARGVSNRILFLDQGRIGTEGTPKQLFCGDHNSRFDQFASRFNQG